METVSSGLPEKQYYASHHSLRDSEKFRKCSSGSIRDAKRESSDHLSIKESPYALGGVHLNRDHVLYKDHTSNKISEAIILKPKYDFTCSIETSNVSKEAITCLQKASFHQQPVPGG